MARRIVDVGRLHAALDAKRTERDLSWRQLAKEIGVSPSTMSRLTNEDVRPDVDAFAAMVTWLGVPAEKFMVDEDDLAPEPVDEQLPLMAELSPLLRARSDLEKEDVEHLEELIRSAVKRFAADRTARKD